MGTKTIYWEKLISCTVVLALGVLFCIYAEKGKQERKKKRNLHPRYTVGVVTDHYNPLRGGAVIGYEFTVYWRKYSDKRSWPRGFGNFPPKGQRYFVKFEEDDPYNAEFLIDSPFVKDNLEIPENGWKQLPQ
ncbi:hypothetical protein SAMN05421788_106288 [Filimonas lacunae]|uniref:DUF3592 domain-containing protein n=1 Tax=Filimonas lacunae TaxID=477680 RepID=A0A1N7QRC9_9BACT|nr:hypothetical protein [Filimonas lacunae]SIT25334.1 hypothetical protein SAMN05421788_106288 [Filimonas lacunae]